MLFINVTIFHFKSPQGKINEITDIKCELSLIEMILENNSICCWECAHSLSWEVELTLQQICFSLKQAHSCSCLNSECPVGPFQETALQSFQSEVVICAVFKKKKKESHLL